MRERTISAVRSTLLALALAALAAGLSACGSSGGGKQLTLVAYSTPQGAYASLIPAFQATSEGAGASFSQSYGPSGDQSRAVVAGLKADVVNFSLEPDVTRLVKAGLVSPDWNKNATHGFVTESVAVIIVRKGNPKHITGWGDLIKPGVGVVTPNPFTSGSARWNIMAAYGAQIKEGKSPAEAQAYLQKLFGNVVSQDSSARNALQTFLAGRGDALIDYEDEAIADQKKGSPTEYIVPKATILIQNPIAIVSGGNTAEAQKFVNYLLSPAGQKIWAEKGYRPVIEGVAAPGQFPTPADLFTIEALGGWKKVGKQFFETEGSPGIVTKIEQSLGVSTSK
ncbi:MAG TPA: sulfate ABC transporter substrate-binding protein [Solirubrobacteraceae bacterium]|jgi:sulfate transport system substrate-binding protein|nr:sulfate ABC transporter substrate-binding protein [Solirubrobacteraceae bacterium]